MLQQETVKDVVDKREAGNEDNDAVLKQVRDQGQPRVKKIGRRSKKKVRNCECSYVMNTCVLFRKLFTNEEIDLIHQIAAKSLVEGWGSQQRRNFGKTGSKQANYSAVRTGGHTVTFLEENFAKRLPHIFSFMNKVMRKVDHQTGWNILSKSKVVNPRRLEFLQYSSRHNPILMRKEKIAREKKRDDGLGWHYDTDSLMTMVLMCSHRDMYEGGLLQIKVKPKKCGVQVLTVPDFDRGDAVVFLAENTEHRVTTTTGGRRCSFVYELWNQEGYDEGTDTSSGYESHDDSSSSSTT